ncbi:hypothetical protein [Pseudanabaena sp. 'Roaring Creek']|uniref:hypothetical protein n=1 Tax=Pseudanabaena sp. 'Roaring Creek' TaxID=1681830 RepID=UPI0006D7DE2F|nr:hypothetical protein [Pseudanabaena sp. 'Roaring Creek']
MSAIANSNQPEGKQKTSRVKAYWQSIPWKKLSSLLLAIALCFYLTACGGDSKPESKNSDRQISPSASLVEVSPPTEIQRLSRFLEKYTPQVSIVSPKPDEVLPNTDVSVKFDVKNLPIFKNAEFGLGPHVHVTLDNQEYKALYDLNQTVTFEHLSAGTHTIRAFASRPWHESFKNEGAYAQTTFHVLTKTGENAPEAKVPLLTYSRPVGTYGAEPIMLDFYVQNVPLPELSKDDLAIDDWQVRATVDGQSFTFDRWEPIYLKGFNAGQNWVKLELIEPDGDAIANVFNSTAHVINYQPNGTDTLARLVRGEKIANIDLIVNPDYVAPTPTPVESASPVPVTDPTTSKEENASSPSTAVEPLKQEVKPADSPNNDKDAKATSIIPVVPVVPVAPLTKSLPAIEPAPIKVKSAPAAPITAPANTAPAIKVAPKNAPDVETVKPPAPISVKTAPVTPAKTAPTIFRSKYAPITEPAKAVTPAPLPKVSDEPSDVVTSETLTSETATSEKDSKEKDSKAIAPKASSNYFKNFNFDANKFFPTKPEATKPEATKPEVSSASEKPSSKHLDKPSDLGTNAKAISKSASDAKSDTKSDANDSSLTVTDLSATSTPVKVLTK